MIEYEVLRSQGAPPGDEPIGYREFKNYLQEKDISPRQTSRKTRAEKRTHAAATPVLKHTQIRRKKSGNGEVLTSTAVKRRKLDFVDDDGEEGENISLIEHRPREGESDDAQEFSSESINLSPQVARGILNRRIIPYASGILKKWKHY